MSGSFLRRARPMIATVGLTLAVCLLVMAINEDKIDDEAAAVSLTASEPTFSASPSSQAASSTSTSLPQEELPQEELPQKPFVQRTFWTSDLHDGPRADLPSMLSAMGHRIYMAGVKGRNTPYPDVYQLPGVLFPSSLPNFIQSHPENAQDIREFEIRQFFEFGSKDAAFRSVDAFICAFPMSMCEAYMPFNKTVVWLAAHRYSLGRTDRNTWQRLSEHLQLSADRRPGGPRHIVAALGEYDAQYINYYTGLDPLRLGPPALLYINPKVTPYKPNNDCCSEILVGPLQRREIPAFVQDGLRNANKGADGNEKFIFKAVKERYPRFELSDIVRHRAVLLLPYAVLSFGITEIYALNIPMFVPCREWLAQNKFVYDRFTPCCQPVPATRFAPPRHPQSNANHTYSPEDDSYDATVYWLQYADYFQWPHIQCFNTFDHLINLLHTSNFTDISARMSAENERRQKEVMNRWAEAIDGIDVGRQMPASYSQALKELWGVNQLQVF